MPVYEWKCTVCGHEEIHRMSMSKSCTDTIECGVCGSISHRMVSRSSFNLKGGGWYESGYTKNQ